MTVTEPERQTPTVEMVSLTIDDTPISVPKGTLVIRAAELLGVQIPRFCDHPLLDPVGACRQCLVEVEGQRKPMASCTTTVSPDMVVRTQLTSPSADKAQHGVMELLLINHPLDCPVCDKGGECPLQNQAMVSGRSESRFDKVKRTYPKPIPLSPQVLLDRERCVLCARCTRFSTQIAGDPFIELLERGALQQVGIATGEPFDSYFSGNTVQICPVGALTGSAYRFRARPFDLVSTPSVCEHCASGCAQRTDHRRGTVLRRLAGDDPDVNEEWNCDKGRWAFAYPRTDDRILTPLIRHNGQLQPASWPEAIAAAATGLAGAAGVLTGGRATVEDAYSYSEFARKALHTNDIDFRIRAHSDEELEFLATRVAGHAMEVTYADLEDASVVVLAGFEPEEEAPIIFLRLRKAARTHGVPILAVAPFASRGAAKLGAQLVMTTPGDEAAALSSLDLPLGAIILAGERLAAAPGALTAAARLADRSGARLAWVPRRAGDRGALEAGCLPNLLPGGRPVDSSRARDQVATAWHTDLPATPGRDTAGILAAAAAGELEAVLLGAVDPEDLPDPAGALAALDVAAFVVSLEMRHSAVTALADVVFPVAPVAEKAGSFLTWEGRSRPFPSALASEALTDAEVLAAIAAAMGYRLTKPNSVVGVWNGRRPSITDRFSAPTGPGFGEAVLATWKPLLDDGLMQDGAAHLAQTARPVVARLSAATAAEIGVGNGDPLRVSTPAGGIMAPTDITTMPDRVVWLPTNSRHCHVHRELRVGAGALVTLSRGVPS
ncbi:NADH-quinone oxidoreductase subunit G [Mycobacterium sp. MS1601]|uniref:NADH-quinone oxidoreductase subunit G n=1 Tax=Mycobacterium sp. MS1601 TaxID=1936029 RepID=UPI0009793960|nr:NADH-quinone oxidoreductase subunit G [Mycobacterium sp. MS1601]AQA05260.1 NADH-quinone oxidoreductase subunit G [Mycobacterium sp. MS1601]